MKSKILYVIILSLFYVSLFGQTPTQFDTCFSYSDVNLEIYFKVYDEYFFDVVENPISLLYADTNFALFYSSNPLVQLKLFQYDFNKRQLIPLIYQSPVKGAFVREGKIYEIYPEHLKLPTGRKIPLIPDALKDIDFRRFDAGLKRYAYDIERDILNYIFRDANNIIYHFQYDIEQNKTKMITRLSSKHDTNAELKYLYFFSMDSLCLIETNVNTIFHSQFFIQEGYKLISVNSYPVIFDRDNHKIIVLLEKDLRIKIEFNNEHLVEASPVSAYSSFEHLYLLVRESNRVHLLKYKYKISLLRIKRNAIYAKHGRTFKTPALQELFNQQPWYKLNPNYSDSLLTKLDKEKIHNILQLERKIYQKTRW